MNTQQQLINQAKNYVRNGAALNVHLPNDDPEDWGEDMAVEVMFLDHHMLRYAWLTTSAATFTKSPGSKLVMAERS